MLLVLQKSDEEIQQSTELIEPHYLCELQHNQLIPAPVDRTFASA